MGLKEASSIYSRRGPEPRLAQGPWCPARCFSLPSARRGARASPGQLFAGRLAAGGGQEAPVSLMCSGLSAGREAVAGRIFRCDWKKVGSV